MKPDWYYRFKCFLRGGHNFDGLIESILGRDCINCGYHEPYKPGRRKRIKLLALTLLLLLICGGMAQAQGAVPEVGGYNVERLATAIYHAEGGANTRHPYGILVKYKTTTPRQACINTIRSKHREWLKLGSKGDYLSYLQSRYAPIGVSNDPTGLNRNWLKNVRFFYVEVG